MNTAAIVREIPDPTDFVLRVVTVDLKTTMHQILGRCQPGGTGSNHAEAFRFVRMNQRTVSQTRGKIAAKVSWGRCGRVAL